MRVAEQDTTLALGSVILVVLLNVFLAFAGRVVIRMTRSDTLPDEMEPLTGLLNRHALMSCRGVVSAVRSTAPVNQFRHGRARESGLIEKRHSVLPPTIDSISADKLGMPPSPTSRGSCARSGFTTTGRSAGTGSEANLI
jgi:hypothetical protein